MDLVWLWLIVPSAYIVISLFFLCFPNIIHKRNKYQDQILNELVQEDKILCIGHRGGGFQGPQNTLQLFKKTQKPCHMFELDICFTKDEQLVVHHDINLLRTTGINKQISQVNYKDLPFFKQQIQSFGGGGIIKTQKNKIPLLDQLFQQFPDTLMNIELKTPSQKSIAQFARLVKKYGRQSITIWGAMKDQFNDKLRQSLNSTVNFYSIWQVFKIFLLTITGLLPFLCIRQGVLDIPLVTQGMQNFAYKMAGGGCRSFIVCIILSLLKFFNLISRLFIPHLRKRGILTFYWIVNDQQGWKKAISTGCRGIMTDLPSNLSIFLANNNLYYRKGSDSF